jgi:hypothetical protein
MPYKNIEEARAYRKLYRSRNKVKIALAMRKYREENKEAVYKKQEEWRKAHPDKHRAKRLRMYHNNPQFNLKEGIRRRVLGALSRVGAVKNVRTFELIGCTPPALKLWLESKFKPGMGWHNRSEWHIDHIRPCASFDLTDPVQQRQCFHYSNLQPLWATENILKGASYG